MADLKGNYQASEEMLPKLAMPTLVLWGSHDPFFAVAVGERTQQAIPNAMLKTYEETGHFVPEERPQLVAGDLLAWLAKKD